MAINCFSVTDPQIQPAMRVISSISKENPARITTTKDHGFVSGTIVRFYVPKYYGMYQIDKIQKPITVTSPTTFTVDLDTTGFSTFAIPTAKWYHSQCALVIPIGELSTQLTAAVRDVT